MPDGNDVYYKVRDVVRQRGHSESESCRIFKDWHIELRVGSGHVSVWTSQGMVYMTMQDKPVHYKPGAWEEHLARLHQGRPLVRPATDLRALLRTQALESEEDELVDGDLDAQSLAASDPTNSDIARPPDKGADGLTLSAEAMVPAAHEQLVTADFTTSLANDFTPEPLTEPITTPELQTRDHVFSDNVILIDDDGTTD